MKKVLVTLFALVAVLVMMGTSLQAQSKITYGVMAGASLANWYGSDISGTDAKVGFTGGGFLGIDVSNNVRIQPEILYVMKGLKADELGFEAKVKANYFEIPVLIKWMIPTQGNVKPNLFVGGAPSFLVSAKATGSFGGGSVEVDIKDLMKSVDFGVVFGGGVGFVAGTGTVILDVRYTLGLISIDDTVFDEDIKNAAFSAMIGYAISVGP